MPDRYLIIRLGDIIINLDSRLRFDVIYIHRLSKRRAVPIVDLAILYGTSQVHLSGDDAIKFLKWLLTLSPEG